MKRVFISFASEDLAFVRGVRLIAYNENHDLDFYDESVRIAIESTNSDYIRRVIREKISRASVTVCFVGIHTAESGWVRWELEETLRQGKSIIFMTVRGMNSGNVVWPYAAIQTGSRIWDWNPTLLQQLIAIS